jgi:ATP-dependent exoDNAse (exonuclease V) beta subunit
VLEELDLADPAATSPDALRASFASAAGAHFGDCDPELAASARSLAEALLERLAQGPLLPRLRSLAPELLARELPVLLPGAADPGASSPKPGSLSFPAPDAPVGYTAGAIDLLYRDPESGQTVVADFKTDAVAADASDAELLRHAERYRAQLERYGWAVAQALELPRPPRLELWFLAAGRVAALPANPPAALAQSAPASPST